MTQFLALLRGINVGGNRLIKMQDLRQMFEGMKLQNVSTYIQSGNVLFNAKESDKEKLRQKIEKSLFKELDYQVDIYIRALEDMQAIVEYDAFRKMNAGENAKTYISFLSDVPTKAQAKSFETLTNETDHYHIHQGELYSVSYRPPGDVLNVDSLLKKHLGMKATTRNWNTTQKLYNLMIKG